METIFFGKDLLVDRMHVMGPVDCIMTCPPMHVDDIALQLSEQMECSFFIPNMHAGTNTEIDLDISRAKFINHKDLVGNTPHRLTVVYMLHDDDKGAPDMCIDGKVVHNDEEIEEFLDDIASQFLCDTEEWPLMKDFVRQKGRPDMLVAEVQLHGWHSKQDDVKLTLFLKKEPLW